MSWPKKITVDKRIVRILSGSTYANFPSAIREIISNSYDADAENVYIEFSLANEIISIRDDGKGMNEDDFAFYLRIAGKSRKRETLHTESKRKIIGQFGVGFLSALPFCQKYYIETKKKGTNEIVHATISSTEYFSDDFSSINVDEIPIHGGIRHSDSLYNEQFTRIRLIGFSSLTKSFFNSEYRISNRRNTIYNLAPLELLKWSLSEYLPIKHDDNDNIGRKLNKLHKGDSKTTFSVYLNGKPIFRNIHATNILEISEDVMKIGDISFRFFISSDYKPINPTQGRYLLLRNLNVGVGERDTFGLGMEGKVYGKLAHLTGDIYVEEGLNDLISVSRDKFNFSPDYEKLKEFLRSRLAYWANHLDNLQKQQKFSEQFGDTTKVSDLQNLKKEKVEKTIKSLEKKGFTIKHKRSSKNQFEDSNSSKNNLPFEILKKEKEIIIPNQGNKDYAKIIVVLGKEYKLKLESWDHSNSELPAVKIEDDITLINESYPLFQDKKQLDTFLKIHLVLLDYRNSGKISKQVYFDLINDLNSIFNNSEF